MTWWGWLLIAVGLHLVTGFLISCAWVYLTGRENREQSKDPDFPELCTESLTIIPLWPLFVALEWILPLISNTYKSLYRFGKGSTARKLERQHKKIAKRELKQLCVTNGWSYRAMRHTLDAKSG